MSEPAEECPTCGAELEFDEVDIGVGVQRGNAWCPDCGWYAGREDDDSFADIEDDDVPW